MFIDTDTETTGQAGIVLDLGVCADTQGPNIVTYLRLPDGSIIEQHVIYTWCLTPDGVLHGNIVARQ